jgi:hypothetical protein
MTYKYFLPSIGYHFPVVIVSFAVQEILVWCNPIFSSSAFAAYTFGVTLKKSSPRRMSYSFFLMFFSLQIQVLFIIIITIIIMLGGGTLSIYESSYDVSNI